MSDPRQALVTFLARLPQRRLLIALSGGIDSRTLLHLAAEIRDATGISLRAVHIDHGLHPDSGRWAEACRCWCDAAHVPIDVVRVAVTQIAELGREAAARAARRAAFAEILDTDEVLLTAHHRDDQAETFLLRALRAAGYDGLAGMRPLQRFGRGWLARPWLNVTREAIRATAIAAGLDWIEDPSNTDLALDRNFLRHQIVPRLARRWPQAVAALAGAAAHAGDLLALAESEVQRLLARHRGLDPTVLDANVLDLPEGTAVAVLKAWLRDLALPSPPPAAMRELWRQMRLARGDRVPEVRWSGVVIYRYRERLHAQAAVATAAVRAQEWWPERSLRLHDGRVLPALPGLFDKTLWVKPRQGGEKIRLRAGAPRRPVRLLLQEYGVPPWQRDTLPFLWHEDTLLAVGDLFLDTDFQARLHAAGRIWRIESGTKPG